MFYLCVLRDIRTHDIPQNLECLVYSPVNEWFLICTNECDTPEGEAEGRKTVWVLMKDTSTCLGFLHILIKVIFRLLYSDIEFCNKSGWRIWRITMTNGGDSDNFCSEPESPRSGHPPPPNIKLTHLYYGFCNSYISSHTCDLLPHLFPHITGHPAWRVLLSGWPSSCKLYQNTALPCMAISLKSKIKITISKGIVHWWIFQCIDWI